jgi:hypothetical protein
LVPVSVTLVVEPGDTVVELDIASPAVSNATKEETCIPTVSDKDSTSYMNNPENPAEEIVVSEWLAT